MGRKEGEEGIEVTIQSSEWLVWGGANAVEAMVLK